MSEEQDAFHRDFQEGATAIARLYGSAYTLMEIEMGTATAERLAPYVLHTIVTSAERAAVERETARQRQALLITEEANSIDGRRKQLTIEDALEGGGGVPW